MGLLFLYLYVIKIFPPFPFPSLIKGQEFQECANWEPSVFFSSFTPIQNNMQNCSSVYLNLYIFGQQTGREKILHWMIASILWLQSGLNFFWMEFWSAKFVPKYLKCSTLSKDLFSVCVSRFCSAFCCRHMTIYLVLSAFTSRPNPLLTVTKPSVFFVIVCTLLPSILRLSAWSPKLLTRKWTYLF